MGKERKVLCLCACFVPSVSSMCLDVKQLALPAKGELRRSIYNMAATTLRQRGAVQNWKPCPVNISRFDVLYRTRVSPSETEIRFHEAELAWFGMTASMSNDVYSAACFVYPRLTHARDQWPCTYESIAAHRCFSISR